MQSVAISGHQRPISGQSAANPMQSEAIRGHQRPSPASSKVPGLLAQNLETQRDGVVVIALDVPECRQPVRWLDPVGKLVDE